MPVKISGSCSLLTGEGGHYAIRLRHRAGFVSGAVLARLGRSGPIGDRSHSSALFPAHGFMHNPNEVCIAPLKQLRDALVEKALIRP